MRPTDLSMPYHDDGLVHELLTTLAMSFLLGCGATAVGLPSFIGHMAAGEPLPTCSCHQLLRLPPTLAGLSIGNGRGVRGWGGGAGRWTAPLSGLCSGLRLGVLLCLSLIF